MSQQATPTLGQLCDDRCFRDAIHVAIAPVIAGQDLLPAQHVGLLPSGEAAHVDNPIGIVDPFLAEPVRKGERFYLCLYANTVTGMRHAWSHPAFRAKVLKEV